MCSIVPGTKIYLQLIQLYARKGKDVNMIIILNIKNFSTTKTNNKVLGGLVVLPDPFRGIGAWRNSTETQQSGHANVCRLNVMVQFLSLLREVGRTGETIFPKNMTIRSPQLSGIRCAAGLEKSRRAKLENLEANRRYYDPVLCTPNRSIQENHKVRQNRFYLSLVSSQISYPQTYPSNILANT